MAGEPMTARRARGDDPASIFMSCWHRPGKMVRGSVTCRFCGVFIVYCPCVGPTFRSVDDSCQCCNGSMWVAMVRGRIEKFGQQIGD